MRPHQLSMIDEPVIKIVLDPYGWALPADGSGCPVLGLYVAWPVGGGPTNVSGDGPDEQTALDRLGANLRRLVCGEDPYRPLGLRPSDQLLAAAASLSRAELTDWLRSHARAAILADHVEPRDGTTTGV